MSSIDYTLGIDLGTTNTVACRNFKALELMGHSDEPCVLPSAVAYMPTGARVVGVDALRRRAIDAPNAIVSAKRVIGLPWTSSIVARYMDRYGYRLTADAHGHAVFRTRAGDYSPTEIGAHVLEHVVRVTGERPHRTRLVISVPAAFDAERQFATEQCARLLGFEHVVTVHEPVATAIAYLNRSNARYAFVYDLGGGTFDAAIIECKSYPFRVVAHVGDSYLGGDDIDAEIAAYVTDKVLQQYGWDLTVEPNVYARVIAACERAKRQLSSVASVGLNISDIDDAAPPHVGTIVLTQIEVRQQTLDLVRRTFLLCDQVLSDAGLKARDIDAVFLAGGSSQLAGVTEYVHAYFDKRPRADLNPMQVVGLGASLIAARPAAQASFAMNATAQSAE